MGILGGIVVALISFIVGTALLSFFWPSRIGCILLSSYSAYLTYQSFNGNLLNSVSSGEYLWGIAKVVFFMMLSFICLCGRNAVDMSNDGVEEWFEDGSWHASLGDDWFVVYLKYIVFSALGFGALCFFGTELHFEQYLFALPVLFGICALISSIARLFSK